MNPSSSNKATDRREFLRGGLRYALLAGISALAARAFTNGGGRLPGQTCINEGICSPCPGFADCGLPQALSLRQSLNSKAKGGES